MGRHHGHCIDVARAGGVHEQSKAPKPPGRCAIGGRTGTPRSAGDCRGSDGLVSHGTLGAVGYGLWSRKAALQRSTGYVRDGGAAIGHQRDPHRRMQRDAPLDASVGRGDRSFKVLWRTCSAGVRGAARRTLSLLSLCCVGRGEPPLGAGGDGRGGCDGDGRGRVSSRFVARHRDSRARNARLVVRGNRSGRRRDGGRGSHALCSDAWDPNRIVTMRWYPHPVKTRDRLSPPVHQ